MGDYQLMHSVTRADLPDMDSGTYLTLADAMAAAGHPDARDWEGTADVPDYLYVIEAGEAGAVESAVPWVIVATRVVGEWRQVVAGSFA